MSLTNAKSTCIQVCIANHVYNRAFLKSIIFTKVRPSLGSDYADTNLLEAIRHNSLQIRASNSFMSQLYIYCLMKD